MEHDDEDDDWQPSGPQLGARPKPEAEPEPAAPVQMDPNGPKPDQPLPDSAIDDDLADWSDVPHVPDEDLGDDDWQPSGAFAKYNETPAETIEPTEEEKRNGWTSASLSAYVHERKKAQANSIMNERPREKPTTTRSKRFNPKRWGRR